MIIYLLFILLFLSVQAQSTPTLDVRPKILSKSGDSVVIQWSGVDSPSDLDWLGIYSPPDSPHDHFIGYKFLSLIPHLEFWVGLHFYPSYLSLRSQYSFRIFRWRQAEINPKRQDHDHNPLPGTKHFLAESEWVGFKPGRGPEQIHLAWTGRDGEMRVVFVAEDKEERGVRYGENDGEWGSHEMASVERYEQEDMCEEPANSTIGWRDPGWIFDAVMKHLKGGVRYYYQVGSDTEGWSTTRSFVSWNPNSDETTAFLFGDMGTSTPYNTFLRTQDESVTTMKWILRDIKSLGDRPAFVSHIGDISYARGYSWLWDEFFTLIDPVASSVPYHVCIGNHEYDWPSQPWRPDWSAQIYGTDGGGECGVPYSLRFKMPGNSSESTGTRAPATRNLYFSFNMGAVHFVYISTETNFLPGSSQYNFIKQDLESVNRKKMPFVVVQGHRPMYTTSNEYRDAPIREKMLAHLEPLFVRNNVTLVFWGHVHRYERFCPLNNFTCVETGPVHVVIGMAGQDWQPIWEPRPDHPNDPVFPQPKRSLYRGGEFGYSRLVATREKLTLSYVGNHDGEVHDSLEILASQEVHNGAGSCDYILQVDAESRFLRYVRSGGALMLGAISGFVLGFVSAKKRKGSESWIPVKNNES